jgi:hypothetical protein
VSRHPHIVKPHHPPPIQHTPPLTAPPHAIFGMFLPRTAQRPLATCIVYPDRVLAPPLVNVRFPTTARPRSLHGQPILLPASQCTYPRVCFASRLHQHRRMCVAARRT